MPNYLEGPDEKVQRAHKHIEELAREYEGFLHGDPAPYAVFLDEDSEPGKKVVRARVLQEPPLVLAVILGDILHNLRSALDFVAWQCVLVGGGTPDRNIYFPIEEDAGAVEYALRTKVKGAGKDSIDLIRAAKPYKDGNRPLWLLHHLNRLDKHQLLPVVAGALNHLGIDVNRTMANTWSEVSDKPLPTIPPIFLTDNVPHFPLKDGQVLTPTDETLDFWFPFYVGLGQTGYADGQPLLETAHTIGAEVRRVIETFRPILS